MVNPAPQTRCSFRELKGLVVPGFGGGFIVPCQGFETKLRIPRAAAALALVASVIVAVSPMASAQTAGDVHQRDQLIAAQENLLNAYRCLFAVDLDQVPGSCPNPDQVVPGPAPDNPSQADIEVRDQLVQAQEALLNTYRCANGVDLELVPDNFPGRPCTTQGDEAEDAEAADDDAADDDAADDDAADAAAFPAFDDNFDLMIHLSQNCIFSRIGVLESGVDQVVREYGSDCATSSDETDLDRVLTELYFCADGYRLGSGPVRPFFCDRLELPSAGHPSWYRSIGYLIRIDGDDRVVWEIPADALSTVDDRYCRTNASYPPPGDDPNDPDFDSWRDWVVCSPWNQ